MDHSAGENDRHKFRTVTKKSIQTVLKNLEGFYIIKKEIDNAKFPKLTNRVHYLKHEEGGVNAVCEIMRKYSEEVAEKAYQQGEEAGKEIGQRQANIAAIKNMIIRFRATKEVILEDYTESEYNTAIAELESESR